MRRLRHRECRYAVTRTTKLLTHKGEELLGRCTRHVLPIPVERTLSALRGRERWSPITALREKASPVAPAVRENFEKCAALLESTRTPSGCHLQERRALFKMVPAAYTAVREPDLATRCYRATAAAEKMVVLSKCCCELAVDILSHQLPSTTPRGGN